MDQKIAKPVENGVHARSQAMAVGEHDSCSPATPLQSAVDASARQVAQAAFLSRMQGITNRESPSVAGQTGTVQRMLYVGGNLVSSGNIVNPSQRPGELNAAVAKMSLTARWEVDDSLRGLALDSATHTFATWQDAVKSVTSSTQPELKESVSGEKEESKESLNERPTFTRTGHTGNAHDLPHDASVKRAISKDMEYNGRWKSETEKNKLIDRLFKQMKKDGVTKGAYFVRCIIPLEVGCADDKEGVEHPCDGFFIKMKNMGTSMKKWKFSTCHPRIESTLGGSVTVLVLK
jgi:hypothetical protein